MKINSNEYANGSFNHLKMFIGLINDELCKVSKRVKNSSDPDSEGLYDLGEYLIGYGFVAMQHYIASTYPQTSLNKSDVYRVGLKLNNEQYLIDVIDAGANYWKHEPEWPSNFEYGEVNEAGMWPIFIKRSGSNLENMSKRTYNIISKVTPYADYTLSNLLAKILEKIGGQTELSFAPILPFLEEWRNDLDIYAKA